MFEGRAKTYCRDTRYPVRAIYDFFIVRLKEVFRAFASSRYVYFSFPPFFEAFENFHGNNSICDIIYCFIDEYVCNLRPFRMSDYKCIIAY